MLGLAWAHCGLISNIITAIHFFRHSEQQDCLGPLPKQLMGLLTLIEEGVLCKAVVCTILPFSAHTLNREGGEVDWGGVEDVQVLCFLWIQFPQEKNYIYHEVEVTLPYSIGSSLMQWLSQMHELGHKGMLRINHV